MFDIQNYASFLIAILVFQCVPGPGTVAILDATARNGMRAGFGAVLGTLLGDFIYMTAAVLGLAAAMRAHPLLFEALQWFGAGYLCWIGLRLLRAHGTDNAPAPCHSAGHHLRRACAVSLTNPKVMLFFVAFFPLFLRPDATGGTLAAMMLHVTALSFLYQAGLVLLGNAAAARLRAFPFARRLATRLAGIALVGFGLKLAAANR
ncbi:MAG: LysE family transporter [Pseudomonadota bacterium]